ncbi:MAG TPA: glycosyltransferase [Bryobacteraceae bacterium]|nr:glycosyltransferase [Bryobacteraceae bacterium]
MNQPSDIVILGLSITSSWGNGHATTYRSLVRGLAGRGHRILFLERDAPWYAGNRDTPHPEGARTELYHSVEELIDRFEGEISTAELVILGSFVPDGVQVGEWITSVARGTTAFYDIDTPVTMGRLAAGCYDYISPDLIARFHLYLSFTGGPLLRQIESRYRASLARALYCSVDPEQYQPSPHRECWDLGYLGTYSDDRQPALEALMLEPARQWPQGRFTVVGPMYPERIQWPYNVNREIHLSPREHPGFYGAQRFTLNVTREAMKRAGYSPSVRLFEAGACGVPIISDWWEGLDSLFEVGHEVLISTCADDTLRLLREFPDAQRLALGDRARRRILAEHTPRHRAIQLESYWREAHDNVATHPARRHRRWRSAGGLDAGVAPQPARQAASGEARGEPGQSPGGGHLHQPAGANH